MKKSIICISCPLGCNLSVEHDDKVIISVSGNACKRGPVYAQKEVFSPERVVTSTIKIEGAKIPLLPVRTDKSVSKDKMFEVMKEIFKLKVKAPAKRGDIICQDICKSGANLIATRTLDKI
ncbi:MAG TPA: NAD(FAD)-dependent dehydrogenase [Lentisphaeria bacterium]|nr:MAG: NAD(FAD)-dependent dehydrogenase [Lentisphaerae bacterium GWF2_38_69]HBM14841.1 NAD(FAD)-dependent dehydrogenase [Lentisphaeria bacterium]